jgi:DNA-binding GntR family transcriptional regulator
LAPSLVRPEPPFLQIATRIRDQILAGDLREGDLVPSTRQISQAWGVAIATATKALTALRAEGYTRAVPGVGTVVSLSDTLKHAPRDRVTAFRRGGRIYPPNERAQILAAELVAALPHVADALAVQPGTMVIRRRRVTYHRDTAVSASTSWFDGALAAAAPLLLETERITSGTAGYIEERTGRGVAAGRDQLMAAAATDAEASDLGVPTGSAVLRGRNWFYDSDGDVIEFGEFVFIPGRWTSYDYEIARPED